MEEKQRTRIALSSLIFENCVVKTKGEACGACAEVCPSHAVRMTPWPESPIPRLTRPVFDEAYCIGCGACLVACPAGPSAFIMSAVAIQSLTPGMRPGGDEGGILFNPAEAFPF
jgi:ferredoxin